MDELKRAVYQGNLDIVKQGLVTLTWGNVSSLSEDGMTVAIKPSGVPYDELKPEHIVLVDLVGRVIEGNHRPSSDTPTHLYLYQQFPGIKAIVHTHSTWATMFAQARREIRCFGTTHADHFFGSVPLTRPLTKGEVEENYERNTGVVIVERFKDVSPRFPIPNHLPKPIDHLAVPAVLVAGHAPFTWGESVEKAVHNAIALEAVAKIAYGTQMLALERELRCEQQIRGAEPLESYILEKHYNRKHGQNAYYGQK